MKTHQHETLHIGIQGYKGSFNEQACMLYCEDHGMVDFSLQYLYTTEKVLRALSQGVIDFGIFAMSNSRSGIMMESLEAVSAYRFHVLDVFDMPVSYALLGKKGVSLDRIKKIISHPAILDATREYLEATYGGKEISSGEGILLDQAALSSHLAEAGSPSDIAVVAPAWSADMYGLFVLDDHLENTESMTT